MVGFGLCWIGCLVFFVLRSQLCFVWCAKKRTGVCVGRSIKVWMVFIDFFGGLLYLLVVIWLILSAIILRRCNAKFGERSFHMSLLLVVCVPKCLAMFCYFASNILLKGEVFAVILSLAKMSLFDKKVVPNGDFCCFSLVSQS